MSNLLNHIGPLHWLFLCVVLVVWCFLLVVKKEKMPVFQKRTICSSYLEMTGV